MSSGRTCSSSTSRATSPATHARSACRSLKGLTTGGRPVLFAILIVIAAFIPLMALRGIEGRLFVPLALSIIFSMVPVYARLSGFGTRGVAAFMAVSILAAVLTQYPVGRLSDRLDRRTVIASMCLVATVVAAVIELFGPLQWPVFLALAALFSGSALTLYSLSVSHVNDKLEPSQMVAASSALLQINGTAAALGPLVTGSIMGAFGARAYFAVLGTLTGTLTLYDLWRKLRRSAVPRSQKSPFINTRDLVTSAGLDPAVPVADAQRVAASTGTSPADGPPR